MTGTVFLEFIIMTVESEEIDGGIRKLKNREWLVEQLQNLLGYWTTPYHLHPILFQLYLVYNF